MTKLMQHMQLALRERRRWILLGGLWALLAVICGVAGPFGTHDALPLPARLAYWSLTVGISMLSSVLPFMTRDYPAGYRVAVWALYVVMLTALIFALNGLFFEGWRHWDLFLTLLGNVALIVCAVHIALWLIEFARPATKAPDLDPQTRFLRRVPLAARGPLVRIEAQDHYLNVVTTKGASLILMRMSEAVDALSGASGILVHRSHWVALPAVKAYKKDKGRDLLLMSDGAEVPVSRSNREAAKDAGLF